MNREERRNAKKDLLKMEKGEMLLLFADILKMLENNKITIEMFEEHKTLIEKAWLEKYQGIIELDKAQYSF